MKSICLLLVSLLFVTPMIGEEKKADPVIELATQYFTGVTTGDLGTTDLMVGVPYSFDGKKVLTTLDNVKAMHRDILAKKGKRPNPKTKVSRPDKYTELDKTIFKEHYDVIRIHILEAGAEGEYIDIYVKNVDGKMQIIGFKD